MIDAAIRSTLRQPHSRHSSLFGGAGFPVDLLCEPVVAAATYDSAGYLPDEPFHYLDRTQKLAAVVEEAGNLRLR